jgi:uncharacterized protein YbbC (DUF1343 family)
VVPMRGYRREFEFRHTGLPWVLPSPNMPSPATARVYPGGCLLEGTSLSEGRGTTRPFEIWGAPFVDGSALAATVKIAGARLRPLHFIPAFDKFVGQRCGGVQVHMIDPKVFCPYESYLRLIAGARRLFGDAVAWNRDAYEFVADRPAIDLLTGGPEFRVLVDAGGEVDDWLRQDALAAQQFSRNRREFLLY